MPHRQIFDLTALVLPPTLSRPMEGLLVWLSVQPGGHHECATSTQRMVIGKAAADFLDTYPIMTRFSASIDGRANHTALHGPFDMTVETEEGETRMGKWLATYLKEGGRWRLATDCWNLDAPMQGRGFWY